MSEAKLFDRGTLRVTAADGRTLFEHVRVIARRDRVELYAQTRHYPDAEPVDGAAGVVLVASLDGATVHAVAARRWNLHQPDGSVAVMVPDGRCSTCSGNPLGRARL